MPHVGSTSCILLIAVLIASQCHWIILVRGSCKKIYSLQIKRTLVHFCIISRDMVTSVYTADECLVERRVSGETSPMVTHDVCLCLCGLTSGHGEIRRIRSSCQDDLWSAFWSGDSLACSPGPTPRRHVSWTFGLRFGRLRFGLRGAGVADKLAQELELGQEELPDYIPTWGEKNRKYLFKSHYKGIPKAGGAQVSFVPLVY